MEIKTENLQNKETIINLKEIYVMNLISAFSLGLVLGILLMLLLNRLKQKEVAKLAQEFIRDAEKERLNDLEILINRLKESFAAISYDSLTKNSEQFLNLAETTLKNQTQLGEQLFDNKKQLIDHSLESIGKELFKVREVMSQLEKDREQKYGELGRQLKNSIQQTNQLWETTNELKAALSNTRIRGQWGERMAEDVLRAVGLVEEINYWKQTKNAAGNRPDYTFLLPKGLKVNMDVKFPLDNYLQFFAAEDLAQKEKFRTQFFRDVRNRLKEVTVREYINPLEHTVDYVLVFIPNEQIYSFIIESEMSVLDEALKAKVILCSPLTLYAFLTVIRQAVESYSLEQTTTRILSLLNNFYKQWEAFCQSFDKLGKKIDDARTEYGVLVSTRTNQLEKSLQKLEELRKQGEVTKKSE